MLKKGNTAGRFHGNVEFPKHSVVKERKMTERHPNKKPLPTGRGSGFEFELLVGPQSRKVFDQMLQADGVWQRVKNSEGSVPELVTRYYFDRLKHQCYSEE